MKIATSHTRNPAIGWDVDITVTCEAHETVRHVSAAINGSPICDEDVADASSWHKLLVQKGQFPGENRLVVTALDSDGEESTTIDDWQ